MKIHLVPPELFHAGGRKDRHDEANSSFPQFYESAYKWKGTATSDNPFSKEGQDLGRPNGSEYRMFRKSL